MPTSTKLIEDALQEANALRFSAASEANNVPPKAIVSQAIENAIGLRRLERASRDQGFRAVALPQYLTRLARETHVEHLLPKPPARPVELRPWIKLARDIQSDVEHLALWIRGWFAIYSDLRDKSGALTAVRAHSVAGDIAKFSNDLTLEAFSRELGEIERTYDVSQKAELDSLLGI